MGWQDRRYDDQEETFGGRARRAMRRIFVEGDDFLSWSVPLFRVSGIAVRIHIFYIVLIAARLIWPVQRDTVGYAFAAFSMATLFVLVLLHEFGHCIACRAVGGEADRIVMWPLGGLAMCRPPHNWKAALVTTAGGPAVNLLFIPILGGALLLLGSGWRAVVFNPFDYPKVWALPWFGYDSAYWKYFLWSAYYTNLILFLFNVLLIMFPMDGGRIFQELLWSRLGYRKSMLIAVNVGLVLAIGVGIFAITTGQNILFAVAFFCGFTCFNERRRVALLEEPEYNTGSLAEFGYGPRQAAAARPRKPDRAFEAARKKQQRALEEQAEEDRILAKIGETGMQSLTRLERKTLEEATRRRRERENAGG
jgi:Zn-dependent protease